MGPSTRCRLRYGSTHSSPFSQCVCCVWTQTAEKLEQGDGTYSTSSFARWILRYSSYLAIMAIVGILLASNVDIVAGSRAMDNSELTRREGFYRRCASRVLHRIVVATGMSGLSDTQCGLKVFRSENASVMFAEQVCTRFAFDIEMLLRAERFVAP